MNEYRIGVVIEADLTLKVEAESRDAAIETAKGLVNMEWREDATLNGWDIDLVEKI